MDDDDTKRQQPDAPVEEEEVSAQQPAAEGAERKQRRKKKAVEGADGADAGDGEKKKKKKKKRPTDDGAAAADGDDAAPPRRRKSKRPVADGTADEDATPAGDAKSSDDIPMQSLSASPALTDSLPSTPAPQALSVPSSDTTHITIDAPNEKEKKGKNDKRRFDGSVPLMRLFRFADRYDIFLMIVGVICSIGHGVLQPLFSVIFGNIINAFGPQTDNMLDAVAENAKWFLVLAAVAFVTSYFQVMTFLTSSHRQANRIREEYFKALLRQEIAWYDAQDQGAVTSRMASDIDLIQEGMSDKLTLIIQNFAMFTAGFVVGMVYSWQMTLVILALMPVLFVCAAMMGKIMTGFTARSQKAYSDAGMVAEEVIGSMRTVTAFGGQAREASRYGNALVTALKMGQNKAHAVGIGIGCTLFVVYCAYGLAFWYGSKLLNDGSFGVAPAGAGTVLTVFFSVLIGSMSIGQAAPHFSAIANARGAAYEIFRVIDRVAIIDNMVERGQRPDKILGNVSFRNVHFRYPTRPDVPILRGLNLEIQSGTTVALVGASGCGKSTTVALLERFYDPDQGEVLVDGVNVKDLSLRWLREHVGLVSQEPILFSTTIAENIAFGKDGATQAEIEAVAAMANAHEFIMRLPNKYNTLVGERGSQLSGGQKQRIAIARALLKNPTILLLDEATSALDNKSEKVVQDALDKASKGRTTIVIAHRLSTIRNADRIVCFEKGVIVESGTHDELMQIKNGIYRSMTQRQALHEANKEKKGKTKGDESGAASPVAADDDDDDDVDAPPAPPKAAEADTDVTSVNDKDDMVVSKKKSSRRKVLRRAYGMSGPEWYFIMLGGISAIGSGAVFPLYSLIISELVTDLMMLRGDALMDRAQFWALIFFALACFGFISQYCQQSLLTIAGERLTDRLRKRMFATILNQEMAFFDKQENSIGVLATKLATDATQVQGATSQNLGLMVQSFGTLGGGILVALIACWRVALVVLACIPLAMLGGFMRVRAVVGFNLKTKKAYEQAGFFAAECIGNVRTVIALNRQETFMHKFHVNLQKPRAASLRSAHISGAGFGLGEAVGMLIFALAFWYGSQTVNDMFCDFTTMFRAVMAIVFGAMITGQINSTAPDVGKAQQAAREIFELFDRPVAIPSDSTAGRKPTQVTGLIEYRNIHFRYPSRPDIPVVRGLSLTIKPGQTVALVGASGCGKSTLIQLLERFYDPLQGQVLLDGVDLRDLNVQALRSSMALVQQEPVLFACSIAENIRYGKPDATDQEIVQAAINANAFNFIDALPDKFNTFVGDRGTQLSGGQKQRIAIARAMIRNPKILLLDEATSALDSESEHVVQEALDRASQGRTTIMIAHRLSTVRHANCIVVIDQGQIVEQGTHEELMNKHGHYYSLVMQTQRRKK